MTGIVVVFGLGVFLVFDALTRAHASPARSWRMPSPSAWVRAWLSTVGSNLTPLALVAVCSACAVAAGVIASMVVVAPVVALFAFGAGAGVPIAVLQHRRRARQRMFRASWADALDLLAGAVRAGETLPGALAVVAERGPVPLQPAFRAIVSDHRVSGDLGGALARFRDRLADPVADQMIAALLVAQRVGGRELVRVVRALARFVRTDAALRSEIEARQSWTVVAARVAAAAPWCVLLLVATRHDAAAAFDSHEGVIVLTAGLLATIAGYRLMLAAGRLPAEPRVFGGGA